MVLRTKEFGAEGRSNKLPLICGVYIESIAIICFKLHSLIVA